MYVTEDEWFSFAFCSSKSSLLDKTADALSKLGNEKETTLKDDSSLSQLLKKQLKKEHVYTVYLEKKSSQFSKETINLALREAAIKNHSGRNAQTIFGNTDFESAMTFTHNDNDSRVALNMDVVRTIIEKAITADQKRLPLKGEGKGYRKFRHSKTTKAGKDSEIELTLWEKKITKMKISMKVIAS